MAASGWRSAIAVLGMSGVIALLAARPAAAVEMISTGGDWLAPVGLAAPAALTDAEMSSLFMDGGRIRSGRKDYWLSFGVQEFFSDLSGFVAFKN
ncbi:MAG: hypothetical protein ACREJ2_15640, partial [Planctomycetota bacterium]